MTTRTCGTCTYYQPNPTEGGTCRAEPPATAGTRWPGVDSLDWCGQHKPRTGPGRTDRPVDIETRTTHKTTSQRTGG